MSFGVRRHHYINGVDLDLIQKAGLGKPDGFLGGPDAAPVYTEKLALAIAELEADAPPVDPGENEDE